MSGRTVRGGWTPPRALAGGYLGLILVGSLLLLLPWSTERTISVSDAVFTSTSAATVTGLAVVDPGSTFTWFGEAVLLLLMQLGGLGLMTFAMLAVLLLGRRLGLRQRLFASDALGIGPGGGVARLVRTLVVFSVTVELLGAGLLALRMVPELGWRSGLWQSLFHSVSAFNNAGVGLRSDNLVPWARDPLVGLTVSTLFIVGGIGFTVVAEIARSRSWRELSLHARLMIAGTLVLNVVAALAMFAIERGNPGTIGGLGTVDQIVASWFQATSPRTAGFNVVDMTELRDTSVVLTMVLMFVGAGSVSTAGGIKLTTAIVLVLASYAYVRGHSEPHVLGRTIAVTTVLRAATVVTVSMLVLVSGIVALTVVEQAPLEQLAFEATSAFATVGLTLGVTTELGDPGRGILVVLMFLGRIGPLAMAFSFASRTPPVIGYPRGDVMTG